MFSRSGLWSGGHHTLLSMDARPVEIESGACFQKENTVTCIYFFRKVSITIIIHVLPSFNSYVYT